MKYSFKKEKTMTALCVICVLLIAALFIVFVIRTIKGNQKTYDLNQESAKESLLIPDVMHTNNDLDYWSSLDETHPEKVYERVINTPEAEPLKTDEEWHFFLLYSDEGFRMLCLAVFLLLAIIALCTWKSIRKPNNRDIYKYMDSIGGSTHAIGENVSFLMNNALRKEDLTRRSFWTEEALRKQFEYEGTEKSEEFLKWAYIRIWYSNDLNSDREREFITDQLRWGNILTLYEYAYFVSYYKGYTANPYSISELVTEMDLIRKPQPKEESIEKRTVRKKDVPEETREYPNDDANDFSEVNFSEIVGNDEANEELESIDD